MMRKLFFLGIMLLFFTESEASVTPLTPEDCVYMQTMGVITSTNPVPCERLNRVSFPYINFEGAIETGSVVVLDVVAYQVENIFAELLTQSFPIHKSVVMENYHGDDEASMADNNSSAFNGRPVTDGSSWSKHAYGVAIDVNPVQNPYLSLSDDGSAKVLPPASAQSFVNRNDIRPNKAARPGMMENVVEIFTRHGFMTWGGEWDFPIDYQHFEIGSRTFINELITQPPDVARQTFNDYARSYQDCVAASSETDPTKRRVACVEKVSK